MTVPTPRDPEPVRPCPRHHRWLAACADCTAWHQQAERIRQEAGAM